MCSHAARTRHGTPPAQLSFARSDARRALTVCRADTRGDFRRRKQRGDAGGVKVATGTDGLAWVIAQPPQLKPPPPPPDPTASRQSQGLDEGGWQREVGAKLARQRHHRALTG
jgi:hypothetical protein